MTSEPTNSNTLQMQMNPVTQGGYPNIADSSFLSVMAAVKKGGAGTQSFFDATNETASFWDWMASHDGSDTNPFVPATDSEGNPIMIASNGNVSMRMGAFYNEDSESNPTDAEGNPTPIGIGTLQTGNTTNRLSRDLSVAIALVELPAAFKMTKALWTDLLGPIYANMKTLVIKLAKEFQQSARNNGLTVGIEGGENIIADMNEQTQLLPEEIVAEGAEYMAVDWTAGLLDIAGLGVLAAIPIIVVEMGHPMINSLSIINQSNLDFTWQISYQESGKPSVLPSDDGNNNTILIPAVQTASNIWGTTGDETPVAYEADFQFVNSNDYGSIGYVMTLIPSDGSPSAQVVVSIPWAGENTIWVGSSNENPVQIYDTYSDNNGNLSVNAAFTGYQVTVAINALQGKTNGQYFYGIVITMESLVK